MGRGRQDRFRPLEPHRERAGRSPAQAARAGSKLGRTGPARQLRRQTAVERRSSSKSPRSATLRDQALFLDTRFSGLDTPNSLEATCRSARAGLAVFGNGGEGDVWSLATLPAELTSDEQAEVTDGFYELLLILADAVSQSPEAEPGQRADQAIRIIDRARPSAPERLEPTTCAGRPTWNPRAIARALPESETTAERIAPADAFDFFLIGRELARKSDWKAAISQFEAATQRQPDHFWAQCLLAICHLQVKEPSKARVGLNACLQQKNDRSWLYLLRGIANAGEAKARG